MVGEEGVGCGQVDRRAMLGEASEISGDVWYVFML